MAGSIQTHTWWLKDGHSALACVTLLYLLRGDMGAGRLIMAVVARGAVGTPWGLDEPRRSLLTEQIKPTDSLFTVYHLFSFCPCCIVKKRPLKSFFSFSLLKLGKQKWNHINGSMESPSRDEPICYFGYGGTRSGKVLRIGKGGGQFEYWVNKYRYRHRLRWRR